MIPPVPSLPRRALKDFSFGGFDIPAGTFVGINIAHTHKMAEHWPDPDRFDPMRFAPEAARGRHKYAWVPYRRRRAYVPGAAFRDDADAHPDGAAAEPLPHRA